MKPDDVTNCMRCSDSLERGYSSRWKGDECKEVICFKCDKKEKMQEYLKDQVITSHFMLDCSLSVYDLMRKATNGNSGAYDCHDLDKLNSLLSLNLSTEDKAKVQVQIYTTKIQNKFKEFESKVWFKGLQEKILATNERGVSAKLGKKEKNFCVLTWTGAGRTMLTIEDDDASVTAVAADNSKESTMGYHAITATGEQALALIDKAIRLYEDGTLKFDIDKKVSLF